MSSYDFKSVFTPFINSFLTVKETMGFGLTKFKTVFQELDRFCIAETVGEPFITRTLIAKWRATRVNDSHRTLYDKYSIIAQFCKYMNHTGYPCYVPRLPRMDTENYVPYTFTHEQIRDIFRACDSMVMLNNNMDSKLFAMPAILRLLYSTGMRVGEVIALKNDDIDLEQHRIIIRKTKNRQQRLAPLHPSMYQVLSRYRNARNRLPLSNINEPDVFFFISPSGHPLNKGNVYTWFKKVLKKCGIPHIGKNHGPRVHDLRHACAVHSLMKQVREGSDMYCVLPVLSVFLGHKSIAGTERYVRFTREMFPDILENGQDISSFVFPSMHEIEVSHEK